MSNKKSLGSSPIGFHAEDSSLGFIPDLGVSKSTTENFKTVDVNRGDLSTEFDNDHENTNNQKINKKIVSYNLEVDLITKVKLLADKKGLYYSTLVSKALKSWIAENV